MKNEIKILFKYHIKDETEWRVLHMKPQDYFDEALEYDLDSSPKFANFCDYLKHSKDEVLFIHITVENNVGKKEFKQTFWNEGNNFIIERIDSKFNDYREIIVSSQVQNEHDKSETIRIVLKGDRLFPAYHGFIKDEADGTQSEKKLNLKYFKELFNSMS